MFQRCRNFIRIYCAYENFHPLCSKNEVIVMTSAIHGRMKEGRCLELDMAAKQDPKYFGCSADVLEFMDGKCSGRSECNVRVNDQELLRKNSSCYKDLMKYLESSYACVSGKYFDPCTVHTHLLGCFRTTT